MCSVVLDHLYRSLPVWLKSFLGFLSVCRTPTRCLLPPSSAGTFTVKSAGSGLWYELTRLHTPSLPAGFMSVKIKHLTNLFTHNNCTNTTIFFKAVENVNNKMALLAWLNTRKGRKFLEVLTPLMTFHTVSKFLCYCAPIGRNLDGILSESFSPFPTTHTLEHANNKAVHVLFTAGEKFRWNSAQKAC